MMASFFFFLPPTLRSTATLPANPLLLLLLFAVVFISVDARRGALVRDGMNSKSAWDNPLLAGRSGDVTMDPTVLALTSSNKCSRWMIDPIVCLDDDAAASTTRTTTTTTRDMLGKLTTKPIYITFRSKTLNNARRSNWLRTTASLGGGGGGLTTTSEKFSGMPLRAVWTIGSFATTTTTPSSSSSSAAAAGAANNVLHDSYETCIGRLYGKCVEIEVLLPKHSSSNFIQRLGRRGRKSSSSSSSSNNGRPPPSVVYRVPIQSGHVNPLGMTSKCRALVTLYPRGRTILSSASSLASVSSSSSNNNSKEDDDVVIHLGLTNVHLPLGPGLVDPSWSKGRKVFWKGRSVGLV